MYLLSVGHRRYYLRLVLVAALKQRSTWSVLVVPKDQGVNQKASIKSGLMASRARC